MPAPPGQAKGHQNGPEHPLTRKKSNLSLMYPDALQTAFLGQIEPSQSHRCKRFHGLHCRGLAIALSHLGNICQASLIGVLLNRVLATERHSHSQTHTQ
jgi:hypothetical protein